MMTWKSRVRRALGGVSTRVGKRIPQASPDGGEVDLTEMRRLSAVGDLTGAIQALRDQLQQKPNSVLGWYMLGMKLLEAGRWEEAYPAMARVVAIDPTHLDGFELYVEMVNRWEPGSKKLAEAKRAFARDLNNHPSRHRDALDFVIPLGIDDARDILSASHDPVASAAIEINALIEGGTRAKQLSPAISEARPELSRDEISDAILRVLLARGRYSAAINRLAGLSADRIPVKSLRRAARRALRHKKNRHAQSLLNHLRRAAPNDGWVRDRLADLERLEAESHRGIERRRLIDLGYPFPMPVDARPYDADPSHVLYLLHNSLPYNSAGYATRSHGLLRGLNASGWSVAGVTRPGYPFDRVSDEDLTTIPEVDQVDGVKYHRLSTKYEKVPRSPLIPFVETYTHRLASLIRTAKPFAIHAASNHWNGLAAVAAANEHGIPSIYEVRGLWEITRVSREPDWEGTPEYELMRTMEAEAARAATRVITITGALRDEMVSRGVDPDKIDVVPNGVDIDRFVPLARDADLAERLGIGAEPVIGYIGSVLDYEGIDLLLRAAAELARRGREFKLLIVGDGGYYDRARALASELSLGSRAIFTGRVPHAEVERYYSLVDIAPLPRHALPVCEMVSPLKPFEAMAMGKLVVASDVAALREIVTDGLNGRLHRKGDADSLADVLDESISDLSGSRALGMASRDWVAEYRSWRKLSETVSGVYTSLGGHPSPPWVLDERSH